MPRTIRKAILPLLFMIAQSSAFLYEQPRLLSASSSSSSSSIHTRPQIQTRNILFPLYLFESFFEDENEALFARFDVDKSGAIDKEEFKDVVRKINVDARRREIISVATAALGGLGVASASNAFLFGQKKLRKNYLEPLVRQLFYPLRAGTFSFSFVSPSIIKLCVLTIQHITFFSRPKRP